MYCNYKARLISSTLHCVDKVYAVLVLKIRLKATFNSIAISYIIMLWHTAIKIRRKEKN